MLNSHSSLSLHTGQMLQSLVICVVSHQTCFLNSLGSPEVNSELGGYLSSAEWKERITSFSLLAILFFVQARMLASALATGTHCWLFVQQDPGCFSAKLPSVQSLTSCCSVYWGLFSPGTTGLCISCD